MNINDDLKEIIIKEIDYVLESMANSQTAIEKLYYFSGVAGIVNKVFNIEYDSDLVFAHFILTSVHQNFNQRIESIRRGDVIELKEEQINKLSEYLKELKENFQEDNNIHGTLKKFTVLLYSVTGNGYYLMKKGMLNF